MKLGRRGWGVALAAMAVFACSGKKTPSTVSPSPSPSASSAGPGGLPAVDRVTPLPNPLPDIAARVNGREIPLSYAEIVARRLLEKGDKDKDRPYAYRAAVQQLIIRELLLEEAVARNVSADDTKVDAAYNEARIAYKDEEAWASFLANQGLTVAAFRSEIRTQLTVQALLDQEASRMPAVVSEEEAAKYYESNPQLFESGERRLASHILFRVPAGAPAPQKDVVLARAQDVLTRIRKGEDFATLAKEFSQDPASAGKGGRLAPFRSGDIDPSFERAAFGLKPGEVSGVVESAFGFHIIKMVEILPSERLTYESTKDKIKHVLVVNHRQKRVEALIASLRAKAQVETYL